MLDTGSSDLWIQATVNGVAYTGANASIAYDDGSVSTGPIVLADVTFGNFTVKNQAVRKYPVILSFLLDAYLLQCLRQTRSSPPQEKIKVF